MKYVRAFLCLIIIISVTFTCIVGYKKINEGKKYQNYPEQKCIINLWHVDTFEGGKGSRKQFLKETAKRFEKKNSGIYILVTELTKEGFTKRVNDGEYPDIISFGIGVDIPSIKKLNVSKSIKGGKIEKENYLTSWCRGNYFLFRNKAKSKKQEYSERIVVSKGENSCPLFALFNEDKKFSDYIVKSPLEAYTYFCGGNAEYMLGTQRDIERLKNRDMEVEITLLNGFSDLIQYIAITGSIKEKNEYSNNFIEYLTSEESQKRLKNLSLFSPFYNIVYDESVYSENQNLNGYSTFSPFLESKKIVEINEELYSYFCGEEKLKSKLKNYLI